MMKRIKGFTLVEMILVLTIASMLLVMFIGYTTQKTDELRRDRASLQMQQILNAGMAYYVNNGKWPADIATLQTDKYLPGTGGIKNPWGQSYTIAWSNSTQSNLYVIAPILSSSKEASQANTQILAGRLPLAYVANTASGTPPPVGDCSGTTCYVVAAVNIPGQNLNNARSVNFADLYNSGGCVPAPPCPTGMQPEIIVAPVSVSGVNDAGKADVYPISSFTAYALPSAPPPAPGSTSLSTPLPAAQMGSVSCATGAKSDCANAQVKGFNNTFWRVCLSVTTEKGLVSPATDGTGTSKVDTANMGKILAITRCVPYKNNAITEPEGSNMSIWPPT